MTEGQGNTFQRKFQTAAPRRVRSGLRLRSREGPLSENWIAKRWLSMLEAAIDSAQRAEGLAYARSGQTISLAVAEDGIVTAKVQGRSPQPYITTLQLPRFSESQWNELIAAMASEAVYAAKLLAGEVPPGLQPLCAAVGVDLIPARPDAVAITCTCGAARHEPCKHAATIGLLFADRLSADPLLIFELHGMKSERVVERLRQARTMQAHGAVATHAMSAPTAALALPETLDGEGAGMDAPPLETCLDDFWRCGAQLAALEHAPPPQHVAHALLRRLGPSPMKGKFPMVGLLASVYDEVAQAAVRIRDRAEHLDQSVETANGNGH